jgi:hypothetical protein
MKKQLFERFFLGMGFLFLFAAFFLLIMEEKTTLFVPGSAHLPAIVHSITLGFLVPVALVIFYQLLPQIFGREVAWKKGIIFVAPLHFIGTLMMISGFFIGNNGLIYWGGHYLVSTAITIFFGQALTTAVRSKKFKGKLKFLLAICGLMATVGMGAMLAYDLKFGTYQIYHYSFIVLHLLMGASLFLIPTLQFSHILVSTSYPTGVDKLPPVLVVIGIAGILSIWYGWNYEHTRILLLGWVDLLTLFALLIIQEKILGWQFEALSILSNIRILGWVGICFFILLYLISHLLGSDVQFGDLLVGAIILFLLGPIIPSFLFLARNYLLISQNKLENNGQENLLFLLHLLSAYWIVISYMLHLHTLIISGLLVYSGLLAVQFKLTLFTNRYAGNDQVE